MVIMLLLFQSSSMLAQWGGGEKYPDLKTNQKALQEWQNMKFGLFVHWGPVSLRGTEIGWSRGREVPITEYDNLYKEFNPALFDANEWVKTIKDAGMKYIVITAKHHDGFSIWDSEFTDYDITSTPFKRDILKELSDACKAHGILFGTYYSTADWRHEHYATRYGGDPRPVEESDMSIYEEYLKNQIRELIEKYDTDILWFDGEWEEAWTHEMGMNLYKYIRDLKDDIIINNRVDKGRKGMQGMTISSEFAGDFGTPEQEIGAFHPNTPWESCITICHQWAWKPNDQLKSLKECIQTLASTVGGGGNLLLNVGPMMDGRIEQRQTDRLKEIGTWLKVNGESIYGTSGGPFKPTEWMVSTHKDNRIFVHLFAWPEEELILPGLGNVKVKSVKLLNGLSLKFNSSQDHLIVQLPEKPIDKIDTIIELELDQETNNLKPMDVPQNVLQGMHGSNIELKIMFSQKFSANGVNSLLDNERGSQSFSDGKWLGFESVDFEVVVDLGNVKSIKKAGIGSLQNQNSWIFFPKNIEISLSEDGKKYFSKTVLNSDPSSMKESKTKDFMADYDNALARYIKIKATNVGVCPDWHTGAGGDAWLFVDEIIVE